MTNHFPSIELRKSGVYGNWPRVRLGAFLRRADRFEPKQPLTEYQFAGTYSFARGIFVGERKLGSTFGLNKLQRIRSGDFVYCKIMAWEGAFGVAPPETEGCVMSGAFVLYEIDRNLADPRFLDWYFKLPSVWHSIGSQSTGTNVRRRSLDPMDFESSTMLLPPLDEQRRIVSRVEEMASRVDDAVQMRRRTLEEIDQVMLAEGFRIWPEVGLENAKTLDDVTTFLSRGRHSAQGPSGHYLVKTQHVQQGRYIRTKMTLAAHEVARVKPEAIVKPRDILIACSAAGCLGRVAFYDGPEESVSTDTHVAIARANPQIISPEYLYRYLKGAQGQYQLRSREKGDWRREKISFRLTELNVADMRRVPVPVPTMSEQHRIVNHLDSVENKVDALKKLQSETAAELDALMPSILSKAFHGEL
jgi:type I restriction enzyme, S subunit